MSIISFIAMLYVVFPILLIVGGIHLYRTTSGKAAREEDLERRVEKLEHEVESHRPDDE